MSPGPIPTHAEILALWGAALPERMPDPRGLTQRLTHSGEWLWRRDGAGQLVAFAACRAPESHSYGYVRVLLVHPAYQRRGLGRELVAQVRTRLGPVALALGEERGHFFPGAWPASIPFWEACGFVATGASSVDMRCDLRAELPLAQLPPGFSLTTGAELHPDIVAGVLALTREVFSPRWTDDVAATAGLAPWQVLALCRNTEVVGFALVGTQDDPAVLPSFLYPQGLCRSLDAPQFARVGGLGPVGLHPGLRGSGLGRGLMLAAMHHLKGRGVEVMGIDWTGIAPFYEKLGFVSWAQHRHFRLRPG